MVYLSEAFQIDRLYCILAKSGDLRNLFSISPEGEGLRDCRSSFVIR